MLRLPILALAIVATLTLGCARQDPIPAGTGNAEVIEALREAGSDMDAPHRLEFYMYFPTRTDADRAGKTLVARGYQITIEGPVDDGEYQLLALRDAKLEEAAINALELELAKVAEGGKGYYDGWEAAAVD